MKIAGVICECNPLHSGHAHLFSCAGLKGADAVIAVMSGEFVQRGEAAILGSFPRAEALVRAGVDLVLELPFPYSSAGAEFFAAAGVEILDRLGVDQLWFGSECGDLARLERLAGAVDDPAFRALYAAKAKGREGTAHAFFSCLQSFCGDGTPCLSNDILGISYLCALRARGSRMNAFTVRREGSAYRDEALSASQSHPSATALRRLWREEGREAFLAEDAFLNRERVLAEEADGRVPASLTNAERLILGHFRLTPPEQLEEAAELFGGLGNRMAQTAQKARTLAELLELTETKKYPRARIQRGILFSVTGTKREDLRAPIAYVRLLAANARGREILAGIKKTSDLCVVTRRADLPQTPGARHEEEMARRAHALYTLCYPTAAGVDDLWRQTPVILEE